MEAAAKAAGLTVTKTETGSDFSGNPTVKTTLALTSDASKTLTVELSKGVDITDPKLAGETAHFLAETVKRLQSARPDVYLTLSGLPLTFEKFAWPFHTSTSGADTFVVHGEVRLEDGTGSPLHAKIAAALTQTFATVVAALEQPFAEGFIYNAVRKTMDQGQLELVKSGNRQPVPVTTRYYSMKREKFIFNDTNEQQRHDYLAAKVFWLSHVLGGGAPVWIADPRDAQYLNTTVDELKKTAAELGGEGLVILKGEMASATETLRNDEGRYRAEVEEALAFIKPSFNEDMRGGHTNM
jgi:hypothetical protein